MSTTESGEQIRHLHAGQRETAPTIEYRELLREGVTTALYISLSLLAVMLALPSSLDPGATARPALTIGLTALGLILAHGLAFRLSTRLFYKGRLSAPDLAVLAAQVVAGLAVTIVAVIPVLLFGGTTGIRAAELVLLGFVGVVGYAAARSVPLSRLRALAYVAIVMAITLGVLWVKSLGYH